MKILFHLLTVLMITFYTGIGGCQDNKNEPGDTSANKKNVRNVERKGEVKLTYHKNGAVSSETEYRDGVREGLKISFDEEGNVSSEVMFEDGKMIGEFKAFYPNGSLKMVANYADGVLDGETIRYYPDGKLEAKQTYVKNKLVRNITYDNKGKIIFDEKL